MTIAAMLYKLILGPLLLLFDAVCKLAYRSVTRNPGLLILFLSLAMNFLVLPLYRRADAMQEEERAQSMKLQPGIDHIKKTFKGNERYMMLQTYYRQNHYKPYYALKGSLSLLLEIPFFIAAYRYLSGLQLIQGVAFGPIRNLGAPDGLLHIAGHAVNLLPILMTGINLVSGAIYTRGMPARSKVQLYGMALVFLFFLYDSPSGLVFYWTLNNVFSLVKNIFYKLRNPRKVLSGICSALGFALLALLAAALICRGHLSRAKFTFLAAMGVGLQLPTILRRVRSRRGRLVKGEETRGDRALFAICCVFLTLLLGALIPLDLIRSSPAEFIDIANYRSSLYYVLSSLLLAAGTFLVWLVIFFRLSGGGARRLFSRGIAVASVAAVLDYCLYGGGYGTMSSELQYDSLLRIPRSQYLTNLLLIALAVAAVCLAWRKRQALLRVVGVAACAAVLVMSARDAVAIQGENRDLLTTLDAESIDQQASFPLDRSGRNVVVLMMDRAVGSFLPYILEEKPELRQSFAGFTYYPNTLSYGSHTIVGSPGLFGGYEYTPMEMNRRDTQSLADKHDEALRLMPVLFDENGYDVTVCDPPYAGYAGVPDLSIYDDHPDIQTYITMTANAIDDEELKLSSDALRHRNFFCYSLFRAAPVFLHELLYDNGRYNEMDAAWTQIATGISKAHGMNINFMRNYGALCKFSQYSRIRDEGRGTFLMINNESTHAPMLLKEPEYTPVLDVDNARFDAEHPERFAPDGSAIRLTTVRQMEHYHINMASMLQLAKWMDFMRENGVYDNTRIIIVGDHGFRLDGLFGLRLESREDMSYFNPLLMVKDFDSREFTVDETLMTNADTPLLALADIVENPVNPFTGKVLSDAQKAEPEQLVANIGDFRPSANTGTTFERLTWFGNKNAPLDPSAWRKIGPTPAG